VSARDDILAGIRAAAPVGPAQYDEVASKTADAGHTYRTSSGLDRAALLDLLAERLPRQTGRR
jgi:hypothetical protein